MSDPLSTLDAVFVEHDQQVEEGAPVSIGGTLVFDRPRGGPPTLEDLQTALSARIGALRRYSQRLSSLRASHFFWPRWEPDPEVEIGDHIRRVTLPGPGSARQLCEWTADFFSHPLDGSRPLWELVLLDGLEHGRWALAHKVQHCPPEGIGSLDVAGLLLDDRPSALRSRASHRVQRRFTTSSADGHMSPTPRAITRTAAPAVADVTVHAAFHPDDALDRSRALLDLLVRNEPAGAPLTGPSNTIRQARRYGVVRAPLAELAATGRVLGGSFDDVMLAACAGGLRRLLLERGEWLPARGLPATVPVTVRKHSERALGSRISSLSVELPVDEPVAAVRFARISARTRRLKASRAGNIGPAPSCPPPLDVTITSVPGSADPVYGFGGRLRDVFPVVPVSSEHTVGIGIFSYDGMVSVGLTAGQEPMADLDALTAGIEESLGELRSVVAAV